MKKFLLGSLAFVIYVAPILALYMQHRGAKRMLLELEMIRAAIQELSPRRYYPEKPQPPQKHQSRI